MPARTAAEEIGRTFAFPPREVRARALRDLLGPSRPSLCSMSRALRRPTYAAYDRHVLPLVHAHWPEIEHEPFGKKLRYLACDLYGTGPYTALFCAPNRPWFIRAFAAFAAALPRSEALIGVLAEASMRAFADWTFHEEHRRIVQNAAFIAVIDHAFDHVMDDPFEERGRKLHGLLAGTWRADSPSLALTRALQDEMSRGLAGEERVAWDATMLEVNAWIDAEVRAMTGVEDPSGLCHRLAGVKGTIDGLAFPLRRFVSLPARTWMYDVSLFVQMMDDWLDYDSDVEIDRVTPVITGRWTFVEIARAWRATVSGIENLARAGGFTPSFVELISDVYVFMLREVMDAMIDGVAD
jgi:hypothetical protein